MGATRRRSLLEEARVARRLTQEAVARRAGTAQPSLSAYERGSRSPTLKVAERILAALGYRLALSPEVTFHDVRVSHGIIHVPDRLWRLEPAACFAPISIGIDQHGQALEPLDQRQRIAAYAWLLMHGDEQELFEHLDGALLVDHWAEIATRLPADVTVAWDDLVIDISRRESDEVLTAAILRLPPRPIPRRMRETTVVKRLAAEGLDPASIRAILRKEGPTSARSTRSQEPST